MRLIVKTQQQLDAMQVIEQNGERGLAEYNAMKNGDCH
jgi:hypothetical protein